MANIHYRLATAASVGLSALGVLAVVITLIQLVVVLVNGPDPVTRIAGVDPFWPTLVTFGKSVAAAFGVIVAGGVGRAIIGLAASTKTG